MKTLAIVCAATLVGGCASGSLRVPESDCPTFLGMQSLRCVVRTTREKEERDAQASAQASRESIEREKRASDERAAERHRWILEHPEEARRNAQRQAEIMDAYHSTLNAYGCPGNMLPMGPPMFGCGYPVW